MIKFKSLDSINKDEITIKFKGLSGRLYPKAKSQKSSLTMAYSQLRSSFKANSFHSKRAFGSNFLQKSFVNFTYISNKYSGQWSAHGRYLMREEARKDELGVIKEFGFDVDSDKIEINKVLASWQQAGDAKLHKVIVSPEKGDVINLKEHTRNLMETIQKDNKIDFDWKAVVHRNTDHPHVHIVIRGVDKQGIELVLSNNYKKKMARQRSCEIITQTIGYRQKKDILESRQKALYKVHVTEIDKDINRRIDKYNQLQVNYDEKNIFRYTKELQLAQRLDFLAKRGLAAKTSSIEYKVKTNFLEILKREQLSRDIQKSLYEHRKNIISKDLKIEEKELAVGEKAIGRVFGFGAKDDLRHTRYLMLEGVDGKAYRMRTGGKVLKAIDQMDVKIGDFIMLGGKEFDDKEKRTIKYTEFNNYHKLAHLRKREDLTLIDKEFERQSEERNNKWIINKDMPRVQKEFIKTMVERSNRELKQEVKRKLGRRLRLTDDLRREDA
ncbi:MAG: DUF3363 domain-containing protein [Candidatus Zapsychrus exili]|nr:DUF3363 domain-containing protein [Candidatus Zapsychrus exili]